MKPGSTCGMTLAMAHSERYWRFGVSYIC